MLFNWLFFKEKRWGNNGGATEVGRGDLFMLNTGPPANARDGVQSLGWEDPLEEETATHSGILAWRIPWTEEPGGLQSKGFQSWTSQWLNTTRQRWDKLYLGDFPRCPLVKTLLPNAGDAGSIPGQATKIQHAAGCRQNLNSLKNKQTNKKHSIWVWLWKKNKFLSGSLTFPKRGKGWGLLDNLCRGDERPFKGSVLPMTQVRLGN